MNLDRAPREIPCDRNPDRYVVANNENMKKLSTNDQKWLCHRLFKQALRACLKKKKVVRTVDVYVYSLEQLILNQ